MVVRSADGNGRWRGSVEDTGQITDLADDGLIANEGITIPA